MHAALDVLPVEVVWPVAQAKQLVAELEEEV
jgi:hypothetical protein